MFPIRAGFSLVIFALLSINVVFAQSQNATGPVVLKPSKEFRFISTTNKDTFEKELNDWAKQGLRFARLSRAFNDMGIGGLLVREKEGEGGKYYEYKVLVTKKISTMEKGLKVAAAEGYELRGVTTEVIESVTQNELSEALAGGYNVLEISPMGGRLIVMGRRKEVTTVAK